MLPRLLLILLLSTCPVVGCIWDRDTLLQESKSRPDAVHAITGWFDRYPPRYYEMRLERVTKELAADPKRLDLYDDAGVACSRLGRHDEALAWMEKKKALLDTLPEAETAEARYRYLSNTGTFRLVRWIVKPEADRGADLSDLKASEDFIARALELNPNAHFGREKFQLKLIRWLLGEQPKSPDGQLANNFLYLPDKYGKKADFTPAEARQGIAGLIQLGAAWESVDAFQALTAALRKDFAEQLAYMAVLRQEELKQAGGVSLHPDAKVRAKVTPLAWLNQTEDELVRGYYEKARAAARKREADWLAYQEERFARGMHPDTHPDFWKDWKEPKLPKMPGPTLAERFQRNPLVWSISFVVLLGLLLRIVPKLLKRVRKNSLIAALA